MKEWISRSGALLSSIFASICWIAPALAASLGIAGIGALASLAIYRDYFIALALLSVAYSFFATFQKKYKAGCLSPRNYRFGRDDILLLVTTLLVILVISFPYIRGVTVAQSGASYEGSGSVVGLDEKRGKITLKHEEIKGLMPAMKTRGLL